MAERPQTTVLEALSRRLAADPDGPYLDFEGDEYSARRMEAESNRLAHALGELGVGKGDRVATLLENGPAQVVSFFAALKLGAVQVPVNTAYKGDFLRHQLADSGSKVIVVQGDFAGRVAPVAGTELPELAAAIVVGPPDEVIDAVPTHDWDRLLESSSDEPVPDAGVRPADLACFIYTAGTTGPSKGCMLPHNYIVALADQIARAWQRRPDDVVITPLPLFHFNAISVCVVGTLVVGGKSAVRHDGEERVGDRSVDAPQRLPNDALEFVGAARARRGRVEVHGDGVAAADRVNTIRELRAALP